MSLRASVDDGFAVARRALLLMRMDDESSLITHRDHSPAKDHLPGQQHSPAVRVLVHADDLNRLSRLQRFLVFFREVPSRWASTVFPEAEINK